MRKQNVFSIICAMFALIALVLSISLLLSNPDSFHLKIAIKGLIVGILFVALSFATWFKKGPLSYHDIIDETVKFYSKNPRSISSDVGSCLYNGENGELCAFARVIKPERRTVILDEGSSCNTLDIVHTDFLAQYEHIGFNRRFWRDIQRLHDYSENWIAIENGNVLSTIGQRFVNDLKKDWPSNEIHAASNFDYFQ